VTVRPDEDPAPEATGGPRPTGVGVADAAAQVLAGLDGRPLEDHVEVYEEVHRRLQEGLADLDEP
jgi:hypothetical protein